MERLITNMTKFKMAVRNKKTKSGQLKFNFVWFNRKLFRRILSLFLIVGVVWLGQWGFKQWEQVWPVKRVALQGETLYLGEEDFIHFVEQQSIKGMLAIDLLAMQKDARELDWVKSVEVRKVWPDKLVFVVQEHQPVAVMNDFILTNGGTQIELKGKQKTDFDLPNIEIDNVQNFTGDSYVNVWQEFKQIRRQFELLSLDLLTLKIDVVNNWHLSFAQGIELNLGRKNRAERVSRLVDVYRSIEKKHAIKSIDLRYHNGLAVEWFEEKETGLEG